MSCAVQIMFNCWLVSVRLVCVREGWHSLYFIACLHKPHFSKIFWHFFKLNCYLYLYLPITVWLHICMFLSLTVPVCLHLRLSVAVCQSACVSPYPCLIARLWDKIGLTENEAVVQPTSQLWPHPAGSIRHHSAVSLCIYYSVLTRPGSFCRGDVIDSARARVWEGKEGEWRRGEGSAVWPTLSPRYPYLPISPTTASTSIESKQIFNQTRISGLILSYLSFGTLIYLYTVMHIFVSVLSQGMKDGVEKLSVSCTFQCSLLYGWNFASIARNVLCTLCVC